MRIVKIFYFLVKNLTKSQGALPVTLEALKEYLYSDLSPERKKPESREGSPSIHMIPKIFDPYTLGYAENEDVKKFNEVKESILKAKNKPISFHLSQNKNLSIPSGRKDVIL